MAGAEKNKRNRRREMARTFESFEWLFKDDLIRLDNRSRKMIDEMIHLGPPLAEIYQYVEQQFARVWNEVQQEQAERYDKEASA